MHTLDLLSLVLLGEFQVEANVSFPRASALNHSGLCNKATVAGVGSEIALTPCMTPAGSRRARCSGRGLVAVELLRA